MTGYIHRITAPHFCAGIVITEGKVTEWAPIVKYMRGWPLQRVQAYCANKAWTIELVLST